MRFCAILQVLFCIYIGAVVAPLSASVYAQWTEDSSNPIYNPFPKITLEEDYYPCVIFDYDEFNGDGDRSFYKMWHQGDNGTIALSYSNDGKHWKLKDRTNLPENAAFHPCVLYDKDGFDGSPNHYKIWYWAGTVGTTIDVIQYSESPDGLNWETPQPISQDSTYPLVDGISPGYFYHLYGPGFVCFNSHASSKPDMPYTFPYIMFYDTSSEGFGQGTSVGQIGLAYSTDGLTWTRYGSDPVFIPSGNETDWDGTHAFRPSLIKIDGVYHMFYSGSNDNIPGGVVYAHGIGHASSADGITWTKDANNPIFYFQQDTTWRNGRTYTPFVLDEFCYEEDITQRVFKMWFTGGTGDTVGNNQGIGYAKLPCPIHAKAKTKIKCCCTDNECNCVTVTIPAS